VLSETSSGKTVVAVVVVGLIVLWQFEGGGAFEGGAIGRGGKRREEKQDVNTIRNWPYWIWPV
jgi:hypothetical protein